jgi:serine/threonine-protein kinase RsbW
MLSDPSAARCAEALPGIPSPESWRRLTLHAPREIAAALDPILADLEIVGFSPKEAFSVRMALEEALVNAIKHGHAGDPAKRVRLRYQLTEVRFLAEIEDEGPGFDPHQSPDPLAPENRERNSGRGLFLIRFYMTWVRYNAAGTCVTLCKQRERC